MLIFAVVLGFLAVARATRLLVEDRVFIGYRRWVVNKFGEDSMPSYLAHCQWCTSIWVGAFAMAPTVLLFTSSMAWSQRVWLSLLATLAASMVTGLLAEWKE